MCYYSGEALAQSDCVLQATLPLPGIILELQGSVVCAI